MNYQNKEGETIPDARNYGHITGVAIDIGGIVVQRCAICGHAFVNTKAPPGDRLHPSATMVNGVALDGLVVVWDGAYYARAKPDPVTGRFPPPTCHALL